MQSRKKPKQKIVARKRAKPKTAPAAKAKGSWLVTKGESVMLPDQRPTKDVLVMDRLFKKATARAQKSAFSVRGAIMIQKDGWLAMVDKNGNVVQWVMELKRSKPAKRSKAVRAPAK